MSHLDNDLLLRAIGHAREGGLRADDHDRLEGWLLELYQRRQHVPLRCRVGLHKDGILPGTAGTGRKCLLCGRIWFGNYP